MEESIAIKKFREGKHQAGLVTLVGQQKAEEVATNIVTKSIHKEIAEYAKDKQSLMKQSSAQELREFDLVKLDKETSSKLGKLKQLLISITKQRRQGTRKTVHSCLPAINSIIAKILATYSYHMSAYKYCMTALLLNGGATDSLMDQLAALHDCTSRTRKSDKQEEFASNYDIDLKNWIEQDKPFTVAFDNVDKHITRRHSTVDSKSSLSHMIQSLAFRDRVPFDATQGIAPLDSLDNVQSASLLPSDGDKQVLVNALVREVRSILSTQVKSLKWMEPPHEEHRYSSYANIKSDVVYYVTNYHIPHKCIYFYIARLTALRSIICRQNL